MIRDALTADFIRYELENVTIAMHCHLRPPDVVSVVLGFNYDALQLEAARRRVCRSRL